MPRPRHPKLSRALRFLIDGEGFADDTGWPDGLRALRADVDRLVQRAYKAWVAGTASGRRNERDRNDLIVGLAKAFQAQSGWAADAAADYQSYLSRFLARVLAANGFNVPSHERILRLLPRDLRLPRKTR